MLSVSVICPTFNSANFIERTIATVFNQLIKPFELIISDDGSSDNTLNVIEKFITTHQADFPCHVLVNTHRGPGAARNAGIQKAKGDWIAFLDSDDIWMENKLQKVEIFINDNPEINFFCHNELWVKKNGQTKKLVYGRRYRSDRHFPSQLYHANMFSTSAVVCRRDLLDKHGGFNEALMSAQDYELWLRLSPDLKPLFIQLELGQYISRTGNITSGSLLKRLKNELHIAVMHRHMVSVTFVIVRICRILLSYCKQFILSKFS